LPGAFVEKKGSKTLVKFSLAIPGPVSVNIISSASLSLLNLVYMDSSPPCGIASKLFSNMFMITCSISPLFTVKSGRFFPSFFITFILLALRRLSNSKRDFSIRELIFEDSLVTCRFNTSTALDLLCQAVNAATGWNMDVQEAMTVGRRAANLARAFNLRHGISAELDAPSMRYGSTPLDGVAAGRGIMPHWDKMLHNYYNLMGWDEKTGKPLPQTLSSLGLDFVIPQLWPQIG